MSLRTRPLVIQKFNEYFVDKSVTINSKRLLQEMRVFVWKAGRAEAQQGYNDDLVMSFAIAMYMRDTAFKFKQQGLDLTKAALNNITTNKTNYNFAYNPNKYTNIPNPYEIKTRDGNESIDWLL